VVVVVVVMMMMIRGLFSLQNNCAVQFVIIWAKSGLFVAKHTLNI
jgi:hypothetical protein